MSEDEEFELLEQRIKREKQMQNDPLFRANMAAAEYIASQSGEILAITNIRQAFIHGYRTAWRDKEGDTSKENK